MAIKNSIYISGPRMGTNISLFGIEINKRKKAKSSKSKRKKK